MRYDSRMNRGAFLFGALALAAVTTADRDIPAELRGGRFFALPRVRNGKIFECWLDTDGGGFVFDSAVDEFHLAVTVSGGKRRASLPVFGSPSIPSLTSAADLPVFERSAQDRADPILADFDAQLGRTWFEGRTWRFDWPHARCAMLAGTLAASDANVPLHLERGSPRIPVLAGGETLDMSLDIAASVAVKPGPSVVATTFVPNSLFKRWHAEHPDWTVERDVGAVPGIDRITVPQMQTGAVTLRNIACTTRPGDDVFEGDDVAGKLGANAFSECIVTLDYRTARLRVC
jgi:hypothetical protein